MSMNELPPVSKEIVEFSRYILKLPREEAFSTLISITSCFIMALQNIRDHSVLIKDFCRILENHALNLLEHKDDVEGAVELLLKMRHGFSHNEPTFDEKA